MNTETILPTHIDPEINALDVTGAERIEALSEELDEAKKLRDPLTVDARFLSVLADEYQPIVFRDGMPERRQRRVISRALWAHRHRGTPGAMKSVFRAIGVRAEIEEWFEYEGEPYHFRLDLSSEEDEITPALMRRVTRVANEYKNVRSKLDEIKLGYLVAGELSIGAGAVGEASCVAVPIDGYTMTGTAPIVAGAGAVGESAITLRGGAA